MIASDIVLSVERLPTFTLGFPDISQPAVAISSDTEKRDALIGELALADKLTQDREWRHEGRLNRQKAFQEREESSCFRIFANIRFYCPQ